MPPIKKEKKEIKEEVKEEIKETKPKTKAKSKVEVPEESSEPEVKPKSKAKPKAKNEEPEDKPTKAKAKSKAKVPETIAPIEELVVPSTTKSPEVKKLMDEWSDIQKEIVSISSNLDQKIKRREEISSDIWKLVQTAVSATDTDIIVNIPIKTKSKAGKNVAAKGNETAKTDTKIPILDNADDSNTETDLESLSSCSSESEPSCDEDD